eukprot:5326056-Alexandrium_andersonii.AAC.1
MSKRSERSNRNDRNDRRNTSNRIDKTKSMRNKWGQRSLFGGGLPLQVGRVSHHDADGASTQT